MTNSNDLIHLIEKVKILKDQEAFEEALKILDYLYVDEPNSEDVKNLLIKTLFEYGGYLNDYYSLDYEKAKRIFKRIITKS